MATTKKRRRSRSSRHGDSRRVIATVKGVGPNEFVFAKGTGSKRTIYAMTPRHGDKRKGSRKGKGSRRSRASRRR